MVELPNFWFDDPVKKPGYMSRREFSRISGINMNTLVYWDRTGKFLPITRTYGGDTYYVKEQLDEAIALQKKSTELHNTPGLNITEAKRILGVSGYILRKWDKTGVLKPYFREGIVVRYSADQIEEGFRLKEELLSKPQKKEQKISGCTEESD